VDSDGTDHLSIDQSEDERDDFASSKQTAKDEPEIPKRVSLLATTKVSYRSCATTH
jgi:hypothetical protein